LHLHAAYQLLLGIAGYFPKSKISDSFSFATFSRERQVGAQPLKLYKRYLL
jgi:hypothetical protein